MKCDLRQKGFSAEAALPPLVGVVCLLLAGCPVAGLDAPDQATRLVGLNPEMAALIDAPPVEWPEYGAMSLANTHWTGSEDCTFYGASGLSWRYVGWTPESGSMSFDELGFPSGVSPTAYTFKRAAFTDTSFDVAYVVSVEMASTDGMQTMSYVVWLSGELSGGGQTLTGRQRVAVFVTRPELRSDVSGGCDCAYTMSRYE